MLNQFTGIAKVLDKKVRFDPIWGYDVIDFKLQLCSEETSEEYIFKGYEFNATFENVDFKNKGGSKKAINVNIDDVVAFKGHFTTISTMVVDSIKTV